MTFLHLSVYLLVACDPLIFPIILVTHVFWCKPTEVDNNKLGYHSFRCSHWMIRGITSILLCFLLQKIFIIHGALLKYHESKEKMKYGQFYRLSMLTRTIKKSFKLLRLACSAIMLIGWQRWCSLTTWIQSSHLPAKQITLTVTDIKLTWGVISKAKYFKVKLEFQRGRQWAGDGSNQTNFMGGYVYFLEKRNLNL